MAFTPDGSAVYISLQGSDKLAAIDLRTMEVLWTTAVGRTPAGVLWLNGRVLVADMGSEDIAMVNPANGSVERTIHAGKGAHQLFLSPDGTRLYVNNRLDYNSVIALDPVSFVVLHRYKVPGSPDDTAFAPDGRLWITLRLANKVAVLDPLSGKTEMIDAGRSPHGIFLNAQAALPASVAVR